MVDFLLGRYTFIIIIGLQVIFNLIFLIDFNNFLINLSFFSQLDWSFDQSTFNYESYEDNSYYSLHMYDPVRDTFRNVGGPSSSNQPGGNEGGGDNGGGDGGGGGNNHATNTHESKIDFDTTRLANHLQSKKDTGADTVFGARVTIGAWHASSGYYDLEMSKIAREVHKLGLGIFPGNSNECPLTGTMINKINNLRKNF